MSRRPLVLALAAVIGTSALLPAAASAEDLLQTYELARAGDPQFSAAESTRDATREGAVQARAALLPQLDGIASYSKARSDSTGTQAFGSVIVPNDASQDSTTRNYGLNLNQMLFDRGNFTRLESQRALSRASDFTLEAAGDQLITRTSRAYFNVLTAIESLAAAQTQEAALKKQFDFASKRLEVGLAPITDVHEARAQYDSARANRIVVENVLEDAYQALAEITGQPVRALKGLPGDFQPALPNDQDEEAWVKSALENNPNLRSAEQQVTAAESDVDTARAGHWPTLYLNGNYGDRRTDGDSTDNLTDTTTTFENESDGPTVGVTLRVPIFAGGATQSRVRQSLATRDVRADQFEQARRAVERNTRNAYQLVLAGISEVEARRLAVVSAQSAYDASQVGLEVGTRTVLDILTNQQNLFRAQLAYAEARYSFLQNRLLLEQAAGSLDVADVQDVNRLLTVDAAAKLAP